MSRSQVSLTFIAPWLCYYDADAAIGKLENNWGAQDYNRLFRGLVRDSDRVVADNWYYECYSIIRIKILLTLIKIWKGLPITFPDRAGSCSPSVSGKGARDSERPSGPQPAGQGERRRCKASPISWGCAL